MWQTGPSFWHGSGFPCALRTVDLPEPLKSAVPRGRSKNRTGEDTVDRCGQDLKQHKPMRKILRQMLSAGHVASTSVNLGRGRGPGLGRFLALARDRSGKGGRLAEDEVSKVWPVTTGASRWRRLGMIGGAELYDRILLSKSSEMAR